MIGGAALGISALGLGNVIAAHEAPNFLAGIKKATGASAKGHRLKSFAQGYKDKAHARLKKRLANHKKGTGFRLVSKLFKFSVSGFNPYFVWKAWRF